MVSVLPNKVVWEEGFKVVIKVIKVVSFEEETISETVEDCIVSELSIELVSPVVTLEEDTPSDTVEDCRFSKLPTELVSSVVTFEEDTPPDTVGDC